MIYKSFLLFLSVLLLSCNCKYPQISQTLQHEGNATAALVYYDDTVSDITENHIKIFCSAVFVDTHTILTAAHCVQALQHKDNIDNPIGMSIHYFVWQEETNINQEPTATHMAQVKKLDLPHDLALLTTFANTPTHAIAELAKLTPAVGEQVMVVGHPLGMAWSFLPSSVAAYRDTVPGAEELRGPFLQLFSAAYHGNSGGGAFNSSGELVGLCDFLVASPNTVFFTHLDSIKLFLK